LVASALTLGWRRRGAQGVVDHGRTDCAVDFGWHPPHNRSCFGASCARFAQARNECPPLIANHAGQVLGRSTWPASALSCPS